ncbi:uncharacterized protein DUF1275 [Murinocardiopsis flavida]|uniref:Uncharacterized protein DUF1275 n=2 Tax=Murinocardiopsis flavida TaxID=645275 RepID=A0A2P8CVF1_9ACTN|nr:uncharacterized protein DUF1275 [Murinocardiopsis flavida]
MGPRWTAVLLALLTACAGGVDLLSVVVLGGVFSGVITGDLIHVGHGLGTAAWGAAGTAAAAIGGFGAGVAVWTRIVTPPLTAPANTGADTGARTSASAGAGPGAGTGAGAGADASTDASGGENTAVTRDGQPTARHVTGALIAEVALLAAFTVGWALVAGRPGSTPAQIALLVTAAVAMGGQSALARVLGGSTTYLTGTFTAAIATLATGGPAAAVLNPLVRPASLLLGAVAATLVLTAAPWAAALVPMACVTAALLWRCARPRQEGGD